MFHNNGQADQPISEFSDHDSMRLHLRAGGGIVVWEDGQQYILVDVESYPSNSIAREKYCGTANDLVDSSFEEYEGIDHQEQAIQKAMLWISEREAHA
jgi:hypothetical protein